MSIWNDCDAEDLLDDLGLCALGWCDADLCAVVADLEGGVMSVLEWLFLAVLVSIGAINIGGWLGDMAIALINRWKYARSNDSE